MRRGAGKERIEPGGKRRRGCLHDAGVGIEQAVRTDERGQRGEAGAAVDAAVDGVERSETVQQPEVAEGDHAFGFVVVVGVVARRSVAGDSRRFFTRVARFGLRFVRVELDGERQAHVKDFQQKRQAVAEAPA